MDKLHPKLHVFDHWDFPGPGHVGSAHGVNSEKPDRNRVQELREVVAEITRGRIPAPQKRGPRF